MREEEEGGQRQRQRTWEANVGEERCTRNREANALELWPVQWSFCNGRVLSDLGFDA